MKTQKLKLSLVVLQFNLYKFSVDSVVVLLLILFLLLGFSWHALPYIYMKCPSCLFRTCPWFKSQLESTLPNSSQLTLEPILFHFGKYTNALVLLWHSSFSPFHSQCMCRETMSGRREPKDPCHGRPRVVRNKLLELNMADAHGRRELGKTKPCTLVLMLVMTLVLIVS